ncbi:hypothetical protein [Nocardioides daphniae]|uniref:hypothetical protein n=1 Tax=Nocardioides daphniae TaxID=402297 RepID=UPI001EE8F27C|nr:hypothetical protein [Nocardioides daphniae]
MTNPERDPGEQVLTCGEDVTVEVLTPREVPLGGPRAMTVRRTLPARDRSLIVPGASSTTTVPTRSPRPAG